MYRIDLNSDLGESFGDYTIGADEEIIRHVTSVNVACGWHAGDPMVMDKTVRRAVQMGIGIGAHPGHYDLMGFGRRNINLSYDEIKNYMKYQIGALMAFTTSYGVKLQHVKPHGALGNKAMVDENVARAVCEAARDIDPELIMFGHANSVMLRVAEDMGMRTVSEVYGDRAYMDDGTLVPRKMAGAMIEDEEFAIQRAIRMVKEGTVETITGKVIQIKADSLCVHGDSPKALAFVSSIRKAFEEAGIEVKNLLV